MAEASRAVLGGFELSTDVHPVRYPDRYLDERGERMWDRVCNLVQQASGVGGREAMSA
jgi:DNA polymerase I